jgi:DNA-binding NarL/FixJ family response regulator
MRQRMKKAGRPGPLRLVIADDHQLVRECVVSALEREGFEVVGQAATGEAAIYLAQRLRPDMVLMDVSMPRMGGIAATTALRRTMPAVRVVAFSLRDDEATISQMTEAGACAFVSKSAPPGRLMSVMRDIAGRDDHQPHRRSGVRSPFRSMRNTSID